MGYMCLSRWITLKTMEIRMVNFVLTNLSPCFHTWIHKRFGRWMISCAFSVVTFFPHLNNGTCTHVHRGILRLEQYQLKKSISVCTVHSWSILPLPVGFGWTILEYGKFLDPAMHENLYMTFSCVNHAWGFLEIVVDTSMYVQTTQVTQKRAWRAYV